MRFNLGGHIPTFVLCFRLFLGQTQEDLREKVNAMGGSFDVNLTMSTTHLLAASLDTEKYRVATGMKVCGTFGQWFHIVVV